MAKTAAERQREYRRNKLKTLEGEQHGRLQAIVSIHAKRALERIAKYHGMKQQNALETVVQDFESRILDGLNSEQQTAYYDGTLKASALQCDQDNESLQPNDQTELPLQSHDVEPLQCDAQESDNSLKPNEKKRTGRKPVLNELQCDEIRKRHARKESQTDLAKEFGVSRSTIHNIVNAGGTMRTELLRRDTPGWVVEEADV